MGLKWQDGTTGSTTHVHTHTHKTTKHFPSISKTFTATEAINVYTTQEMLWKEMYCCLAVPW